MLLLKSQKILFFMHLPFAHWLLSLIREIRLRSFLLFGVAFILSAFNVEAQGLVINEFMAANTSTVADEDGDFSDWIELYNGGNTPIQLEGYGLSDDPSLPFKWAFPNREIAAKGYLLVFASDKNRQTGPYLHTNFKISDSGETLQLVNAQGTVIDTSPAVSLGNDMSYGRQPDGSPNWVYFATQASPGAANPASGGSIQPVAPLFSQPAGFYTEPVTLTLSTSTAGAVIRYTLDGSEPTATSPQFTTPLVLGSRAGVPNSISMIPPNQVTAGPSAFLPPLSEVFKVHVVRARTFLASSEPSPTVTHTFLVDPQINQRYPLPVISLSTDRDGFFGGKNGIYVPGDDYNGDPDRSGNYYQRGDAWERAAHLEFFDTDRSKGFSQPVGVRIHGSASRVDPQKSLRIYADEKYGKASIQYPLFPDKPISEYKRFLLRNGGNDRSFSLIRDVFIQGLVKDLNLDVQASRSVIVFLNGEYWGIHQMQERLDKYYLASNHGVHPDSLDYLEMDREVAEGDATHYQAMLDFIKSNDLRVAANYDTLAKWMDVEEFINYQVSEIYAANIDWPGNNLDYWRPKRAKGKWRWIFYDLDFGFGLTENSDFGRNMLAYALYPDGPTFPLPNAANTPYSTFLLRSLMENEAFRNRFISRFADLLNTHFKPARVVNQLEEIKTRLTPVMPEHVARWRSPMWVSDWDMQLNTIRTFAQKRPKEQRQHLADYFRLGDSLKLTLQVSDPARGRVVINSLTIDEKTAGVNSNPYPWQGIYFQNLPIQLTALPKPGFKFTGWQIVTQSGATLPQDASIQVLLSQDAIITALFEAEGSPLLSMPTPFDLSKGSYAFTEWLASQPAASYPPNMVFQRTDTQDPVWNSAEVANYTEAYSQASGTRVNGLGTDGFSFINTGSNGNLGSAVLALNTAGRTNVRLNWTGGTVTPNNRTYAIRLQYRIGNGAWTNVPGALEYVRNETAGHSQKFSLNLSLATSQAIDDQAFVYLRWKYYFVSGNSGPRAELRVADVSVSSTALQAAPTRLVVTSVNNDRSPSRNAPFGLQIESRDEAGNPQPVTANTVVTVLLGTGSGVLSGNISGTILNGQSRAEISGLRYSKAENVVSLVVSRTGGQALSAGTSAPFQVLPEASQLAFTGIYNYGAAGTLFRSFSVTARRADQSVDAHFSGNVTIAIASGSGTLSGTLTRPAVAGVADFSDLVFSQGDSYTLSATATGLSGATSPAIKVAGLTEVLIPQYVQGKNGDNTNRLPYAFRITLHHLNANAKYRYFHQMVLPNEAVTANGAGNVIFTNESAFRRATSFSLNQPGQYGEFTTDASGSYTGWFVTEPTGNNRFTPGNQLRLKLILNDGGGGSDPFFRLAGSAPITVIDMGTQTQNGSAIVGNSCAESRNLIALYDQTDATGHPIAATIVEDDGVANATQSGYAAFYAGQVDGKAGSWGTIVPNALPNGIRRIEQRSLLTGEILTMATSANGTWGSTQTAQPSGNLLLIPATAAPLVVTPTIAQENAELVSSAPSGNQWYLDQTPVAGATAQRYMPTQSGNYRVLVNKAGCPENFSAPFPFVLTDLPGQTTDAALRVYPNPTSGNVKVHWRQTQPIGTVEVRLMNLLGKEIFRQSADMVGSEMEAEIDLGQYPNGIYLLQFRSGKQIETRKVWIQR